MNTHPFRLRTIASIAVTTVLVLAGPSCSEIIAVDDECNVDADCRPRGANLHCEAHLCVNIEDASPGGDAGPGTDTPTDTDINNTAGTDSVSDVNTGFDTGTTSNIGTGPDSDTDADTDSDTDTDTDTDVDADTDGDTGGDTNTGTGTEPDTDKNIPAIFLDYTFTDGLEGFVGTGFTHDAANGYADLALTFDGTNQIRDFEKSYGIVDWSDVIDINAVVRVDQFTSGGVQIFLKSGDNWNWCSKWFDFTLARDWATITMEASYCVGGGDMSRVRSIGIQVHSGGMFEGEQDVHVQIDEIFVRYIESIDTGLEPTDTGTGAGTDTIDDPDAGSKDAGGA